MPSAASGRSGSSGYGDRYRPISVILRRPRTTRRLLQSAAPCAGLEGWRPVDCCALGSPGAVALRGLAGRKKPAEHLRVTDISHCLVPAAQTCSQTKRAAEAALVKRCDQAALRPAQPQPGLRPSQPRAARDPLCPWHRRRDPRTRSPPPPPSHRSDSRP
jgi:hypothetical protein